MTAVQQILYADDTAAWHGLVQVLGFDAPHPPTPEWAAFHGRGSFAVHAASEALPAGRVDLQVMVDDLDVAERALADFEVSRETMAGVGEILFVSCGITVGVSEGSVAVREGAPLVQPIWFATDLDEPRRILEALGLRAFISADGGGWTEMVSDAGNVGLHLADSPTVGLSFVADDLHAIAERLRAAGYDATIVDEAFGRTVRLPSPEEGEGGDEVWINEPQRDLYGYHQMT